MSGKETDLSETIEIPQWFSKAIETAYETRSVEVEDCAIEYYRWGDNSKPCLMLVHGNGGHANWWDFIAPHFMDDYCVCAIHLSGMGNSAYRDQYSFELFAKEVISVAEHAGFTDNITIVGHSLGGVVTIRTAQIYNTKIKGIVIVDSPLLQWCKDEENKSENTKPQHNSSPEAQSSPEQINQPKKNKPKKFYPDFDSAMARFRLIPPQPCNNQFIFNHVARHSIKQYDEGWSWKFDANIYDRIELIPWPIEPSGLECRFTYIYGEQSTMVPEHVLGKLEKITQNVGPMLGIPKGYHHLMLDEPEALISTLRAILKTWLFNDLSNDP